MLIAKILKNSGSFSGVTYNEERRNEGEAELLEAANFLTPIPNLKKGKGYENYLKMWSDQNKRIKLPQLHVVISSRGKTTTKEELLEAAKEWMKQMGYDENPYLVYFHKNTRNNHIHIVSSRVDKYGKKINDSFEKDRSLRAIDAISKVDRTVELRQLIAETLMYSYANQKQFSLILERRGCIVKAEKERGMLKINKAGKDIEISQELVDFCQKRYHREENKQAMRKMKEIVMKYSKTMNRDDFQSYMRLKFGCEFVFFGKEDNPYGYVVIDYKKKQVIPGKNMIPIKKLLNNLSIYNDRKGYFEGKIKKLVKDNPKITSSELKSHLLKDGAYLKDESIRSITDKTVEICPMDETLKQLLRENDRRWYLIEKYKPTTQAELQWLNKEYNMNLTMNDIQVAHKDEGRMEYYREWLRYLAESEDMRHEMAREGLKVYFTNDDFVFIDTRNGFIAAGSDLGMDRMRMEECLFMNEAEEYEQEYEQNNQINYDAILNRIVDGLASFIPSGVAAHGGGKDLAKKKKKRKKQL